MERKTKATKVSLKLVINKKEQRIVYGEADKNFIDFLFTILALPAGTLMNLISTQEGRVGGLANLQRSVEALDVKYFDAMQNKYNLLRPRLPTTNCEVGKLLQMKLSRSEPPSYYACSVQNSEGCRNYYTRKFGAKCPECRCNMGEDLSYVYGEGETKPREGGYVKGTVKYMVMDDLTVKPLSTVSVLKALNVEEVGQIEVKFINLDMNQCAMLVMYSLHSSTVLTDVFSHKFDFSSTQATGRKRKRKGLKLDADGEGKVIKEESEG